MTVEADPVRVESRLAAGQVDCPCCPGVLRPWGWARPRGVHGIDGVLARWGHARVGGSAIPTAGCGSCRAGQADGPGRSLAAPNPGARCTGCGATHVQFADALPRRLAVATLAPHLAGYVAVNPRGCALEPRQRAIVDLALALCQDPASVGEPHLQAARDAGLTDDEIWDVGSITALFAASNRLAHLFALRPNPEFFSMGR